MDLLGWEFFTMKFGNTKIGKQQTSERTDTHTARKNYAVSKRKAQFGTTVKKFIAKNTCPLLTAIRIRTAHSNNFSTPTSCAHSFSTQSKQSTGTDLSVYTRF